MLADTRLASVLAAILLLTASFATADEWPQWRGPNRDGVWRETGLVDKFAGDATQHSLAGKNRQRL